MPNKIVFNWSSGKDSALALSYLMNNPTYSIDHLITTINKNLSRVTMHGTPVRLLEQQLKAIGIPYSFIELPESPSMDDYGKEIKSKMTTLKDSSITHSAYGDIFLEDLKKYREDEMEKCNMKTVFPIWKKDTTQLIHEFVAKGFKAKIVCANDRLGSEFLGREIDLSLLSDLPEGVDPCGENGEFHTFCYDGPIFSAPIHFDLGEKVKRSYPNPEGNDTVDFWFVDLI